ncbi:hypothetical protein [Microcoleus sp. herbarium5]|uniref:hypothetical protein n=1 Tax=Microcoleus sp. herbarium5 TaxID=3055434 RepID=UPI002FCE834D
MSTPSYSPSESPFLDRVRRTIRLKHLTLWVKDIRSNTLSDQLYEGMNRRILK